MKVFKNIKKHKKLTVTAMVFVVLAALFTFSHYRVPLNKDFFSCGLWNSKEIESYKAECKKITRKHPKYKYEGPLCEKGKWKYDTCPLAVVRTNSL